MHLSEAVPDGLPARLAVTFATEEAAKLGKLSEKLVDGEASQLHLRPRQLTATVLKEVSHTQLARLMEHSVSRAAPDQMVLAYLRP